MAFQMVQGRTNNHLTFCLVDATDFATRESAMSAAVKLKVYGTLEGATGVNFVTSGTGSLTNDVVHVGASANGVYHIALAKADLSDASAAWYDEYIIVISATGAAFETFVCEGVRTDTSYLSAVISDMYSAMVVMQSRALLTQSRVSDLTTYLATMSGVLSDTYSAVSDLRSYTLVTASDLLSNILSAARGNSDMLSVLTVRIPKAVATNSQLSDLHSDLRSYLVVMSDVLSDFLSDFQSRVPKRVATDSQLSDLHSDLKSYLAVMSDVQSDFYSDFQSRVPKRVATDSQLSDLHSDLKSYLAVMSDVLSDFLSDFQSRVPKRVATDSQLSDLHSDVRSYLTVMSGIQSDIYSLLVAGPPTNASDMSDLRSAIAAVTATLSASDISDIASAVWANTIGARVDSRLKLVQSNVSDIYVLLSDVGSDLTVLSGIQSDIYSALTAVKTKTDALTYTVSGQVDANVQRINDVTITGDGSGTPFGV